MVLDWHIAFIVGNGKYQVEFDDTVVDEKYVIISWYNSLIRLILR